MSAEPGAARAHEPGGPRPLVVLVPDTMGWVLGAWALEIARHNAHAFDFAIWPLEEIRERPRDARKAFARADVVHCLSQSAFPEVRAFVEGMEIALVASVHHIVDPGDVRPCLCADRVAVMCEGVREALVGLGMPAERLFLLRKGVDTRWLRPRNRREALKRLGLPDGGFTVGCSAKASSDDRGRKGFDVLFDALASMPPAENGTTHLVVTGPGWDRVPAPNVPPAVQIHFFPYLDREAMPDYYSALDVYLCTSRVEGGPMPPFEAMSCGTPVVTTPVGMVPDLLSDGAEGLIVPVGDAATTADALLRLRGDPDLRLALGEAGRRRIEKSLATERVAPEAAALYRGLIDRAKPRSERADPRRENAARIERDLERWRRTLASRPRAPGRGTRAALRSTLRALRRRLEARFPPTEEVAHVDLAMLGAAMASRVLDLGCGNGQLSLPLLARDVNVLSADLDAGRLRELQAGASARALPGRAFRADARRLPLADGSVDAVVCREVLEHLEDPGSALHEVRRILAPGGRLCVTVPSAHTERWFQRVDRRWLAMAGHVHVFRRRDMRTLLERHGFHLLEVRGRNCFYSLFWFVHTLVGTRHDGTGRILEHHALAARIFALWRRLGRWRLLPLIEGVGNRIVPKSYVYYGARAEDGGPQP